MLNGNAESLPDIVDENERQPELASKRIKRTKSEVKKPVSKWIIFSSEIRPIILKENPNMQFAEVAKTVADLYRNMSANDVERLDNIVLKDKERYRAEMAEAVDDPLPSQATKTIEEEQNFLPSANLAFPIVSFLSPCIFYMAKK